MDGILFFTQYNNTLEEHETMVKFKDFMTERRTVDRWFVVKVALTGAFFGALLMVGMSLIGLSWP